ncbi:MAG: hypothetical protein CMI54_08790 [Parcubacteria group bacterium]|nr:hypothetical protein [Parcubacteria group bacterium]|tara:strand:- start:424 stop:666 length:243 start_codon:yes stop_codon:yes gene_type:complete
MTESSLSDVRSKAEIKQALVEMIEYGVVEYTDKEYRLTQSIVVSLEEQGLEPTGFWGKKEGFYKVFDAFLWAKDMDLMND